MSVSIVCNLCHHYSREMSDDEIDVDEEEFEEDDDMLEEDEDGKEEEEEEDMFPDDEPPSTRLVRSTSFEVLPQTNIITASKKLIDEVQQVCGIPTAAAATALLRYFK